MKGAWSCIPLLNYEISKLALTLQFSAFLNFFIIEARHGHKGGFMFCSKTGEMAFGNFFGANGAYLNECVFYQFPAGKWSKIILGDIVPVAAFSLAIVNGTQVFVFGGIYYDEISKSQMVSKQFACLDFSNGLFGLPPQITTFTLGPDLNGRVGASLLHDEKGNRLLLFGGIDEKHGLSNDLWEFPLVTTTPGWRCINDGKSEMVPLPRESHTANLWNGEMVIVAGTNNGARLSDVWFYNLESGTWRMGANSWKHGFSMHTADLISKLNLLVIFGGWHETDHGPDFKSNQKCLDGVLYYDLVNESWIQADIPNDYFIGMEMVLPANLPLIVYYLEMGEKPLVVIGNEEITTLKDKLLPNYFIPRGRAGHTSCLYNDEIFIWSGRDGYNVNPNERVLICFSDMWVFHPQQSLEIFQPPLDTSNMMEPDQEMSLNNFDIDYEDLGSRRKSKRDAHDDSESGKENDGNIMENNVKYNPRPCYEKITDVKIGTRVQLIDSDGRWSFAKALDIKEKKALFHYEGWSKRFNEWIHENDLISRGMYGIVV